MIGSLSQPVREMAVEEAKPKISLDKYREATKDLTLLDILPIAITTISSLRDLGDFSIAAGTLQKKHPEAYETFQQIGEEPQAFLSILVDKIPEEKLKPLVEVSLELAMVQMKMSKFVQLSPDEKISAGKELKEVSTKLNKLLEEMKK